MDITWVRIESWHCVIGYVEGQDFKTLCGLGFGPMANLEVETSLSRARSCENCLRSLARSIDDNREPEVEESPAPAEPAEEEAVDAVEIVSAEETFAPFQVTSRDEP